MRLRQHNYVRTNPRLKILFIKLTLLLCFVVNPSIRREGGVIHKLVFCQIISYLLDFTRH